MMDYVITMYSYSLLVFWGPLNVMFEVPRLDIDSIDIWANL